MPALGRNMVSSEWTEVKLLIHKILTVLERDNNTRLIGARYRGVT